MALLNQVVVRSCSPRTAGERVRENQVGREDAWWVATLLAGMVLAILAGIVPGVAVAALPGDADCNGVRDAADVAALVAAIMNGSTCPDADVNGDGQINAADLPAEVGLLVGVAGTPTMTPTQTGAVPTGTPTLGTPGAGTPTATPTSVGTGSVTATPSSAIPSPTATPPVTATPSATPTLSLSPTVSPTPTATEVPTTTPTITATATTAFTATPTSTPTASNPGPLIVFFGLANSNGCAACDDPAGQCVCNGTPVPTPPTDQLGRQIFVRSQFTSYLIVVEAKSGASGNSVGSNVLPGDEATAPDLQLESNRSLGDGNPTVDCRSGLPTSQWGGIPGIDPPDFGGAQPIIDALTDFGCRFRASPVGSPCTLDANGNPNLLNPNPGDSSVRQFCHLVASSDVFPSGDTLLTARVRDVGQNVGPTAQIIVRTAP